MHLALLRRRPSPASRLRSAACFALGGTAVAVLLGASLAVRPVLAATNFAAGSLIIPMDTDTTGNHATYNQNLGMWKAYGLVYKLLQNGVPISWGIKSFPTKNFDDIDFSATSVQDKRTLTALGAWDYRGGPFIIDSANAAAAGPIIQAWWTSNGNQPNVHEALAPFTADVDVILRSPPRIANELINAGISIAYYNAAGIPDLNGNPWTKLSPNILDETEIANGALFTTAGCLHRNFDIFVTPHNSGYAYSLTDPADLGTRTYQQLDSFTHQGGGWTGLCHSILSNENAIADLTLYGSPAVKSLFLTALPGGAPGGFLTQTGFTTISNHQGAWSEIPPAPGLPTAQAVSTAVAQALPGGSVQNWPAPGNPGAPTYWSQTERMAEFTSAGVDYDHVLAGTYHNGTGLGKITYIGGHSFSTAVPYASNFEGPYLRIFYNSLFFNGSAVAKLDLLYVPTTVAQNGTTIVAASITNTAASVATSVSGATITLEPGVTYLATTLGPEPDSIVGQTLTWNSLGDIAAGTTAVTISVEIGPTFSASAGVKQFASFHAFYGDGYGEGFADNVCREVTIAPVPGPSLTKSPASQGPVVSGDGVTWTLAYSNSGSGALENAVLEDTLPQGFTFSSASPAATTVIPGNPAIIRWSLGTLAGGASGSITISAQAGAVTAGVGDPPTQVFTNNATLTGQDAGGTTYSASAGADVSVQKLSISVDKSVDKAFVTTLPDTVTYTLTPSYTGSALLDNLRVIDPLPAGATTPVTVGQGGTFGAYTPIAAVPGNDPNGGPTEMTVLDTTMSVSTNFVTQGGSVTVTLNVKSSAAVSTVSPTDLVVDGGDATCTGPAPASANVPAGGSGVNFSWTCTLNSLGEYIFTAGAEDAAATTTWPDASSASVLSAATGGPNVVTWNLGSNTDGVPGETLTSGYTAGIYAFRGANTKEFSKYGISSQAWTSRAQPTNGIEKGGSLTNDGAGTLYALEGNSKIFYKYTIATDTWSSLAITSDNANEGGAVQYLNVGGTEYVFALLGNSNRFRRYGVSGNSWANMVNTPNNVKKGGALTTDGTYIYALQGDTKRGFWRCNATTNNVAGACSGASGSWTILVSTPAGVGWGGALTRVGNYIYALQGNGKKGFWRCNWTTDNVAGACSGASGSWEVLPNTPANVADGGALTNDGTYIYAFQGKTKVFWRCDTTTSNVAGACSGASGSWTTLTPVNFTGNVGQGGALVFDAGVTPQGRFSGMTATPTLAVTGGVITVTFKLESSAAVSNVVASALTVTPAGGASCSSQTGPTLVSADANITDINDPVLYQYTCTVSAGATPGSLTFSASATGAGPTAFPSATSNSVIVSPLLTFQATLPVGAPSQVVNVTLMNANDATVSSPPVTTNSGGPVLAITKSNAPGSNTILHPGDSITYTMVVQNTGSGNATSVVVTDTVPANTVYASCSGGTSCGESGGLVTWTIGTLAPGQIATVTLTVNTSTSLAISATNYIITNTASADSAETSPVSSNTVTNQVDPLPTISKSVSPEEAATGDALTYTLVVANPGTTFTADVTDMVPTGTSFNGVGSCSPAGCSLIGSTVTWSGVSIPNGTTSFSFDVTVTATGGSLVTDTANLDPTAPDLSPIPSNQVDTPIGPELAVAKLNNPTGAVSAGNTIVYTLVVSNESNVNATSVVVTDTVPTGTTYQSCTTPVGTCGQSMGVVTWDLGTLAGFDAVIVTFTVQVGTPPPGLLQIDNLAQVTAANAPAPVNSNVVSNPLQGADTLALLLAKSANPTTYGSTGTIINYSYVLTNLGTGILHAPFAVSDDKVTVTCPGMPATLVTGETITCTAAHTITQADLDAGSITNLATATAKDVNNQTVTSNDSTKTVTAQQSPALTISKSANPTTYSAVGNVINYSYLVTNTGNVTLSGPFTVSDDKAADESCPAAASLAPGASITCTASYTITQPDIDARTVTNIASATNGTVTSPTDTETVAGPVNAPSLNLSKSATPTLYSAVGTVINYSYIVTNNGNTPLSGPFTVSDDKATDETCPGTASLAPGASITCTASYTITQADLDAGAVTNVASATNGTVTSPTDSETVTATQSPALNLSKSASPTTYSAAGTVINYTLVATNTGNVTLSNVSISDPLLAALACTPLQPAALAVGTSLTCTGSYTTVPADVTAGSVSNTATASGSGPQSQPVSAIANASVTATPAGVTADMQVSKTGPANASVATVIPYTIRATNIGPDPATGVTVTDQLPAGLLYLNSSTSKGSCSEAAGTLTCNIGDMAVNEVVTIQVGLVVPSPFTGANPIVNTVLVSALEIDPNHNNDSSAASTTVVFGIRGGPPVPTLPPWALLAGIVALGGGIGVLAARRRRAVR